MARLFISYARRDENVVRKLVDALRDAGQEIWIDTEDIPVAMPWRKEIADAIAGAEAVVVIVTPSWLASQPCAAEAQHALSLAKRIVPVYGEGVDKSRVEPRLLELQWIELAEEDVETVATQIASAANADFEWVKLHTRLLLRAQQWAAGNRERSLCLRGRELREAETAVLGTTSKKPAPAELHSEYILASRKNAFRGAMTLVGVLSALALLAAVTAWIALVQRTEARRQAAVAISRQLSAQSQALVSSWPQRATLLAAEGLKVLPPQSGDRHAAEQALRDVLRTVGGRPLQVASSAVEQLCFATSGRLYFAYASPVPGPWFGWAEPPELGWKSKVLEAQQRVTALAVDPHAKRLAIGGRDGLTRVWDDTSMRPLREIRQVGWVGGAAFLGAGRWLATATTDHSQGHVASLKREHGPYQLRLWSLEPNPKAGDGAFVWQGAAAPEAIATSPFGDVVALATDDGWLRVWSVDRSIELALVLGHRDRDRRPVVVNLFDVETSDSVKPTRTRPPHFERLRISQYARWLGAVGAGVLQLVQLGEKLVARPPLDVGPNAYAFDFSPDERWLAVGLGTGEIRVYDLNSEILDSRELAAHERQTRSNAIGFTSNSQWLVSGGQDRTVRLFKLDPMERGEPTTTLRGHEAPITAIAIRDRLVVSGDSRGEIRAWGLGFSSTGFDPYSLVNATGDIDSASFATDGKSAVFVPEGQGGISEVDLESAWPALRRRRTGTPRSMVIVSGNGDSVAALGAFDGTLHYWKRVAGELMPERIEIELGEGSVRAAAFLGTSTRMGVVLRQSGTTTAYVVDVAHRASWRLEADRAASSTSVFRTVAERDGPARAPSGPPSIGDTLARANAAKTAADNMVRTANAAVEDAYQHQLGATPAPSAFDIARVLFASHANRQSSGASSHATVLLVSNDGRMRCWDIGDPTPTAPRWLDDTRRDSTAYALSADGRSLAIGYRDGLVQRFAIEQHGPRALGDVGRFGSVIGHLAFDARGEVLIIAVSYLNGMLRAADLSKVPPQTTDLRGNDEDVEALMLDPTGTHLVTAAKGRILLWRRQPGEPWTAPIVLSGGTERTSLSGFGVGYRFGFSPDRRWLAGSSAGAEMRFWHLDLDDLLRGSCAVAGRALSADEQARYLPGRPLVDCR